MCTVLALWGFGALGFWGLGLLAPSTSSFIRPATGLGALQQFSPSLPLAGSFLKGHLTSHINFNKAGDNHHYSQPVYMISCTI